MSTSVTSTLLFIAASDARGVARAVADEHQPVLARREQQRRPGRRSRAPGCRSWPMRQGAVVGEPEVDDPQGDQDPGVYQHIARSRSGSSRLRASRSPRIRASHVRAASSRAQSRSRASAGPTRGPPRRCPGVRPTSARSSHGPFGRRPGSRRSSRGSGLRVAIDGGPRTGGLVREPDAPRRVRGRSGGVAAGLFDRDLVARHRGHRVEFGWRESGADRTRASAPAQSRPTRRACSSIDFECDTRACDQSTSRRTGRGSSAP